MKKYIVANENPNLIREYNIEDSLINITYNDGRIETVPYSLKTINYIDELMFEQYEDFDDNITSLINNDKLAVSVGVGMLAGAASLTADIGDDNALLIALIVSLGTTAAIETFYKITSVEEMNEDYRKDRTLVENYDVFEELVVNDELYNKLPKHVQNELQYEHYGIIPLSINSVKNLNIRELSKMLWIYNNKETTKKKVR